MSRSGLALGLLAIAVGCGTTYEYTTTNHGSWLNNMTSGSSAQPSLDMSDAQVEAALAERALAVEVAAQEVQSSPDLSLDEAVAAVEACYAVQARDAAEELIATHPQLTTWDQTGELVEISTGYMSSGVGGEIELTLRRKDGFTGALAVAFPPGTYGAAIAPGSVGPTDSASGGDPTTGAPELAGDDWTQPEAEKQFKHWPRPQDLALLRAPVVVLEEGAQVATVRIPVACASFRLGAPQNLQAYSLLSFEKGSSVDSLMLALCAGDAPPAEAETQLAVWLTRDNLTWSQFKAEGGHWGRLVTFGSAERVLPSNSQGAARIMLDAGIDPRGLEFFEDTSPERLPALNAPPQTEEQAAPEQEEPQQAPAQPAPAGGNIS